MNTRMVCFDNVITTVVWGIAIWCNESTPFLRVLFAIYYSSGKLPYMILWCAGRGQKPHVTPQFLTTSSEIFKTITKYTGVWL